jgi:hypothetical protein
MKSKYFQDNCARQNAGMEISTIILFVCNIAIKSSSVSSEQRKKTIKNSNIMTNVRLTKSAIKGERMPIISQCPGTQVAGGEPVGGDALLG